MTDQIRIFATLVYGETFYLSQDVHHRELYVVTSNIYNGIRCEYCGHSDTNAINTVTNRPTHFCPFDDIRANKIDDYPWDTDTDADADADIIAYTPTYDLVWGSGDSGANGVYDNKGKMIYSAWEIDSATWSWLIGCSDRQLRQWVHQQIRKESD